MQVDHLVWYSADLAEGVREFAEWTGRAPVVGGVHPGEGTHNALLSLSDSTYVEILGRDPAQPAESLDPEVRGLVGTGIYHWAAGGADLARLREEALGAGLDGSDLVTGGRTKPDGEWLGWTLFGVKNHGFGALVPFFIDWTGSLHPAKAAPRGGRLVEMEILSPEPQRLGELYRVLGVPIPVRHAAAPALSATIEGPNGRHVLRMFDPVPRGYII